MSYNSQHATYFPPPPPSSYPSNTTHDPRYQQYPTPPSGYPSAPSTNSQTAVVPRRRSSANSQYAQPPYAYDQQLQPVPQGSYLQPGPAPVQQDYYAASSQQQPGYSRRSSHASHRSHRSYRDAETREERRARKRKGEERDRRPTMGGSLMRVVDYVWGMLDPKRK